VASARAGNVIGGGDWGRDRLVPDAVQAFSRNVPLALRNPAAVRPWQYVLDAACGYLILARHLIERGRSAVGAWNFGPSRAGEVSVQEVSVQEIVGRLATLWGGTARWEHVVGSHPHESAYLSLDSAKAQTQLGWRPVVGIDEALRSTVEWYRAFHQGADMRALSLAQVKTFCDCAGATGAIVDGAHIRAPSFAGDSHP
jgi:CDP-glucose 4,6-dehydratase